ncbi:M20/M25/M40 family metallo-hydrolase [Mesorhizobium sp. CAU 1741]|uniref:M20/M25/M40 family metallo-hydrolase n=1 Tax=Mesorhizobium sp. CAU 1741 TaxID=3140366 RepID=UPI00325C1882
MRSADDTGRSLRHQACSEARGSLDEGDFLATLERLVAIPTESQHPEQRHELLRYMSDGVGPLLADMGFDLQSFDVDDPARIPCLLGTRIESETLPTVMIYGHGDVVRGLPDQWRDGLDPWRLERQGDKLYGRGTVDNKGQHLIALQALRAVLQVRGSLGFNVKFFLDMGEEVGSPGLRSVLSRHREACSADVFIAFDGPRLAVGAPEINLGARGVCNLDLVVRLREGTHHSGHWSGLLADPSILLAHALASILSKEGEILVPGWTPKQIPPAVRQACATLELEEQDHPKTEPWWGERGLSRAERIFAWTGVCVLAMQSGRPEAPIHAVQGEARARVSIRHTTDVPSSTFAPALRAHLVANGHGHVEVHEINDDDQFQPARTDPRHPWVRRIAASMAITAGRPIHVIPNNSAGNPSSLFEEELGVPTIWIPYSYPGCEQHGPNEHALVPLLAEGLELTAGIWWDFGDPEFLARHGEGADRNFHDGLTSKER